MALFSSSPKPAPPPVDPRVESAKRLPGSINLCLGPGNCGKTDFAERMSLMAAYSFGVPWYTFDSNGDVIKHFYKMAEGYHKDYSTAKARYDQAERLAQGNPRASDVARQIRVDATRDMNQARAYLGHLEKCRKNFYSGEKQLDALLAKVRAWITEARERSEANNPILYPRAILFFDEAGAIRQADDSFWNEMRQARNAALTIWTATHRYEDLNPVARGPILRNAILWENDGTPWKIKGRTIKSELCSPHQGTVFKYLSGGSGKLQTWDKAKTKGRFPAELIVPAWPTIGRTAGFHE